MMADRRRRSISMSMKIPIDAQVVIRKVAVERYAIPQADIMDIGNLTHAIVKSADEDQHLHLVAISRRLMYCCPLPAADMMIIQAAAAEDNMMNDEK